MDDNSENTHKVTNGAFSLCMEAKSGKDWSHGEFIAAIKLN